MSGLSIAKSIELHLLRPSITREEVRAACERAGSLHLASVCVWPVHVGVAVDVLGGRDTRVCAAIGFPYGQDVVETRLAAIERALAGGARELAVALDHSALVDGDMPRALSELDRILQSAFWTSLVSSRGRGELSIAVETTMLDLGGLAPLFERLHESAAGFLRTGTGHHARTVTEDHIRALREALPPDIGITAVGGVASLQDALGMITAGAVRVGTASATSIIEQEQHAREVRQQA